MNRGEVVRWSRAGVFGALELHGGGREGAACRREPAAAGGVPQGCVLDFVLARSPCSAQPHLNFSTTHGGQAVSGLLIKPAAPCALLAVGLMRVHAWGDLNVLLLVGRAGWPLCVQKRSCFGRCGTPTWSCTWAHAWSRASRCTACLRSAYGPWAQGVCYSQFPKNGEQTE